MSLTIGALLTALDLGAALLASAFGKPALASDVYQPNAFIQTHLPCLALGQAILRRDALECSRVLGEHSPERRHLYREGAFCVAKERATPPGARRLTRANDREGSIGGSGQHAIIGQGCEEGCSAATFWYMKVRLARACLSRVMQ